MTFDTAARRASLVERLNERRSEIEQVALARVRAVSDPDEISDPEYAMGLREAVGAALGYGIAGLSAADSEPDFIPEELLAQARRAARADVGLDTVLRRYFAGYTLLGDFIVREAEGEEMSASELQRVLRMEAALFDRLIASVADEYHRAERGSLRTTEERRVERVRRLLAGELFDAIELDYDLDAWHIGVVASGPGAPAAIRDLAAGLDRRLLAVSVERGVVWAWFGGRRKVSAREAQGLAESCWPAQVALALGEPGEGIDGWRLTHRQAKAAIAIAQRQTPCIARYADVALIAAAINDEVLAGSLWQAYLGPLERGRDGGAALRETLRAYFDAGRNISSAAAALGIARQTASLRLRSIERQIGRPVDACAAELEIALRLEGLKRPSPVTAR